MDRVAFLIEKTGERLDCLLNPENIEITRLSGVRQRHSVGGLVTGRGLADEPLLYTGGGATEVKLDLLFDVTLEDASAGRGNIPLEDVRMLTRPIWALAENFAGEEGFGQLPVARLVWGKAWNIPGVVVTVAERFECFTPGGVPQRSWLRMRFRRVPEAPGEAALEAPSGPALPSTEPEGQNGASPLGDFPLPGQGEVAPPAQEAGGLSEPLYLLAHQHGRPAGAWRAIAYLSGIADPFHVPPGTELRFPPA